jgi:hypothetical protein
MQGFKSRTAVESPANPLQVYLTVLTSVTAAPRAMLPIFGAVGKNGVADRQVRLHSRV